MIAFSTASGIGAPAAAIAYPSYQTVPFAAPSVAAYRTVAAAPAPLVAAPSAAIVPGIAPALAAPAPLYRSAAAPFAAPLAQLAPVPAKLEYTDSYPQYRYAYNVQDTLTGDFKGQEESREGDIVKGKYSLLEADGSRRIVSYYSDPVNGFNAIVQKELPVYAAAAAAAPLVRTAPIVTAV